MHPCQVVPARRRAFPLAGDVTPRFQAGQQRANPFAAHAGTRAFDVSEAEVTQLLANGIVMNFSSVLGSHR